VSHDSIAVQPSSRLVGLLRSLLSLSCDSKKRHAAACSSRVSVPRYSFISLIMSSSAASASAAASIAADVRSSSPVSQAIHDTIDTIAASLPSRPVGDIPELGSDEVFAEWALPLAPIMVRRIFVFSPRLLTYMILGDSPLPTGPRLQALYPPILLQQSRVYASNAPPCVPSPRRWSPISRNAPKKQPRVWTIR